MTVASLSLSRRQVLRTGAVAAAAGTLAACGSGSTFEPLVPTRFVSFGDGWSGVGKGGARATVNDGSVNIWVERLAANYSKPITVATGYAQTDARINTGANSIADQITEFLATGPIGGKDVLVVDAGNTELSVLAGTASGAALNAAAAAAGQALATQARRLVAAGGKHIVVASSADLGKTPFAASPNRAAELTAATRAFNDAFKIALSDVFNVMLFLDNEAYMNTLHASPASFLGANAKAAGRACSAAATACSPTTGLASGVTNYNEYFYADDRHPTPAIHRLLGDNAFNQVRARW